MKEGLKNLRPILLLPLAIVALCARSVLAQDCGKGGVEPIVRSIDPARFGQEPDQVQY